MNTNPSKARLIELDALRCVAVVLVILHHCWYLDFTGDSYDYLSVWMPLVRAGWIGVPMFFVLSGFLIGNMLIREYQEKSQIRVKRFLIRRGFKIYPPLYACVAIYSCYLIFFEGGVSLERVLREIFFLQNYGQGGVIGVSWSLAIEEHFYFLFPAILLLLLKFAGEQSSGVRAIFKPLVYLSLLLVVLCLILRIHAYQLERTPLRWFGTHLRIDALFIGSCLAYWYVGWPDGFNKVFKRLGWPAMLACLMVYTFSAIKPNGSMAYFSKTYYLVLLSIASATMLGVLLTKKTSEAKITEFAAYIGRHSYSIYLFHLPIILLANKILSRLPFELSVHIVIAICVVTSCLTGIVATHFIEWPMLKIRDRFFPASISNYFVSKVAGKK